MVCFSTDNITVIEADKPAQTIVVQPHPGEQETTTIPLPPVPLSSEAAKGSTKKKAEVEMIPVLSPCYAKT